MRQLLVSLLVSAGFMVPAHAATFFDFSVYALGNYRSSGGGSAIGGPVAAAGNATINAENIGYNLDASSNGKTVVAVGGNLKYENSTLQHGGVVYGKNDTSGKWTQVKTPNGAVQRGEALDFDALNNEALSLSKQYASLAPTGVFSSLWGAGTLAANAAGLNVFNLSEKDLGSIYNLKISGKANGPIIINVDGASLSKSFSLDTGLFTADNVLFNFYNSSKLDLQGINLGASILAPSANVSLNGGWIGGNIVAGSFSSAGANVVGNGFTGYGAGPTLAVPEPMSWSMLIVGFGLVGYQIRRRRRSFQVAA